MIPKKDSTKLSFSIWQRLKESNLHHSDSESDILPIKLNLYTLLFKTFGCFVCIILYTIYAFNFPLHYKIEKSMQT